MPATSHRLARTSDGVEIAFEHLGGTGDPILFAHATGFCGTAWRPVVRHLLAIAGEGFGSCWALDARGHGRSGRPTDGNFHWDGTAIDILTVIDAVDDAADEGTAGSEGGGRPHAPRWRGVGHSMGGAALLLAEGRRRGTFGSLWLYEPIVFPPSTDNGTSTDSGTGEMLSAGAARRRSEFESRDAARANYAAKPPMNVFDPEALDGYLEAGLTEISDGTDPAIDGLPAGQGPRVRLACRPEDESQMYLMGGRHGAWNDLPGIDCPTTVARGSTAIPGPAGFAAPTAERLPDGRLVAFEELGHFGPMEAPETMARSIAEALGTDG